MILEGFARRFMPLKGGKNQDELRLTHAESVAVAQVEPPGLEMARAGRRFYLGYNGTAPTGVAPVQAFPTTAAQWAVWNGDFYKSYVIEELGAILLSGTNAVGGTLLACIFGLPTEEGLAEATGVAIANGSGSAVGSKAVVKSGVTITNPAVPVWFPIADTALSAIATLPSTIIANRAVGGRVIVPPQSGLGLAVLAPAGTSQTFLPFASWAEIELDLE